MRKESRIWAFCNRKRLEDDLAEELLFHVEQRANDLVQSGMPRREAERQARVELGSIETYKEDCRAAKGLRWPDELASDVRYAFRTLRRSPLFTLVAFTTLTLGIAVNTSIFSVLDHVLLRPFPFPDAQKLVIVWSSEDHHGSRFMSSFPDYLDWRAQQNVFEELGAMWPTTYYIRTPEFPDKFSGYRATASLFDTFGIRPQKGRFFSPAEERDGHDNVLVISDTCWTKRFGRDPDILGKVLWLNRNGEPSRAYTVIGVLPKEWESAFPRHSEMWGPIAQNSNEVAARRMGAFDVMARLKDGVSQGEAEAKMNVVAARLAAQYPDTNKRKGVTIQHLHANLTGGYVEEMLPVLMGAVSFVLVLACVNVLNLMLARSTERERELATRASLGAGRFRIFRQLMTESLVLAGCAGLAGALLAWAAAGLIRHSIPDYVLRREEIAVDGRVLLFTIAMTLLATLLAGTVPALRGSGVALGRFLQAGRTAGASGRSRLRTALVVGEIALGLVLLAGAGLLINTFVRLLNVDTGFDRRNVLSIQTHLDRHVFSDPKQRLALIETLIERARHTGGVEYAGVTDFRPLGDTMNTIVTRPENPGKHMAMNLEDVGGDYFEAMGIRHLHGRSFTRHDGHGSTPVAIINDAAAEKYWPGENPIGRRIVTAGPRQIERRIVGVVASVRRSDVSREATPAFYVPQAQDPSNHVELVVRTHEGVRPAELVSPLRKEMASVHPTLAADSINIMSEVVSSRLARHRFLASFMGVFGAMALLLTTTGIFGVMAYSVRSRSHEMAVRVALGACAADILRLVIGQGAKWTIAGIVLGLAGALAATRLLKSFLYGVEPHDPLTFALVVLLLGTTAIVAAWLPSRHATRVDPAATLRME